MVTKTNKQKVCIFCGSSYTVTECYEDGYDYDGHHRGKCSSWETGSCGCDFDLAAQNLPLLKTMCVNCEMYQVGKCISKRRRADAMKALKKQNIYLSFEEDLNVENATKCCDYWEPSAQLAKSFFKFKTKEQQSKDLTFNLGGIR